MTDLRKLKANAASIPHSEAEFEKRIRSICERIGVNPDIQDRTTRYAVMGLMFCLQQPEFGKGRGRPKKTVSEAVQLAEVVDKLKATAAEHGPTITDDTVVTYIKYLLRHDPAFGPEADWQRKLLAADNGSLKKKISAGRRQRHEGTK